jgi:hypothetical protein
LDLPLFPKYKPPPFYKAISSSTCLCLATKPAATICYFEFPTHCYRPSVISPLFLCTRLVLLLISLLTAWFCRKECRLGRVWQPQSGQRWSHHRTGYRARRSHGERWRCFDSRGMHRVLCTNVPILFSCHAQTQDMLYFLDDKVLPLSLKSLLYTFLSLKKMKGC